MASNKIKIIEVGPRDGLQGLQQSISTEQRTSLIDQLINTGLMHIEIGSFVSPKKIPMMANTTAVCKKLIKKKGVIYSGLTPNLKGFDQAIQAGVTEVAIFTAVSESFNQHNTSCSIAESLQRCKKVANQAQQYNMPIRGYLSCIDSCPYEGKMPIKKVLNTAIALWDMGCYEISLGDTIGTATPLSIQHCIQALVNEGIPLTAIAIHCHNTYGQALSNVYAALELGITCIDTAIGGLGGCPYAPGASGNLATEDLLYMLEGMGLKTDVNMDKLLAVTAWIHETIGLTIHSSVFSAYQNKKYAIRYH